MRRVKGKDMKNLFVAVFCAVLASACSASDPNSQPNSTSAVEAAMTSEMPFETVESNLRDALEKRDLKLFTVVNHGEGARSVGMDIGKSKLFIFGNPNSGTPLMIANREMGLELPMKVLIYTTETGEVSLVRTDINSIANQYGLTGQDGRLEKIDATLHEILQDAMGAAE